MQRGKLTRGQEGMASIVVVSVLIIILTLISLGFARIITRSVNNSVNRQFSAQATYAAESAINDVASYLKQFVDKNGADTFLPKSTKCTGPGSLIGSSASDPFFNDKNLSGDNSTQYSCILLNPLPNDLSYTQVDNLKSQVVKVNTSAVAGALDKLMISWQASNSQINGYPTSSSALMDETTWNSTTANCQNNGNNASCMPMLRVTIYPISNNELLSNVQAQSKTLFFYPQAPTTTAPVFAYTNASFKDGSLVPVSCNSKLGANTFNPSTDSDYKCNVIISSLSSAITPASTDSVYLRLTPIYNQADIKIRANDKFGDALSFVNDQAIIDVTAQTGNIAKRLQARVDTSSLASSSGGVDTNISPSSDGIPEQAVRSADALCKRINQIVPSNGFASFISFDEPDAVCNLGIINLPNPTLDLNITGNNGQDNGRTVNSESNNPDKNVNDGSLQNPQQQGTVYVGSRDASGNITPGVVTINWTTQNAEFCNGSGGNSGDGWAGDETPSMKFTGNPPITGNGSRQFGGLTNRTEYDLVCTRPGALTPTPTKKVFAWPNPVVSLTGSSSIEAGSSYQVNWSSSNSINCKLSDGPWNNPTSTTATNGSDNETWPVNDNSSDRVYTVTCYDPIGRFDTKSIHVTPNSIPPTGTGSEPGQPPTGIHVSPPTCTATASFEGGSTSNTYINWDTNCDYWDAGNTCETSRHIESDVPKIGSQDGSPCWQKSGRVQITTPGTYHFQIYVWATPWSDRGSAASYGSTSGAGLANSGQVTITVLPPLVITNVTETAAWDQGPECVYKNPADPHNVYNDTWWCRGGRTPNPALWPTPFSGPGCVDGVHKWTMCDGAFNFTTTGGGSIVVCSVGVYGYGRFWNPAYAGGGTVTSSNPSKESWIDNGAVNGWFWVTCNDNLGQEADWWPYGTPW